MKKLILCAFVAIFAVSSLKAEKYLQNLDKDGVAVQGYDPVAFFTLKAPAMGRAEFESEFEGAKYHFASKKHKELFDKEPKKYVPQFGGYCAYGVGRNALVPVKIEAWQIVDGRLLLQKNLGIRDDFNEDAMGNLKKADERWPKLVEKKAK